MKKALKWTALIVVVLIFSFGLGVFTQVFTIFFPLNSCKETKKTFEYQGCSVTYTEIEKDGKCSPCGGIIPCISGFERNKQIDVLKCLCEDNNLEGAQSFAKQFMGGTKFTFKNPTPPLGEPREVNYSTRPLNMQNVCDQIPEYIMYM